MVVGQKHNQSFVVGRQLKPLTSQFGHQLTNISYQLILDTALGLDAFFVGVLDLAHFGYGVG